MKWKFNGKYDFLNSLTNTDSIVWPDKSWFYCEICFSNLRVFRFRRAIENRTLSPGPLGPKKGQKGPFGALDGKIRMYGCEATKIVVVWAPTYLQYLFSFPSYGVSPSGLRHENLHFLRCSHITPIFWGQMDPTQWDLRSPISWGNFR